MRDTHGPDSAVDGVSLWGSEAQNVNDWDGTKCQNFVGKVRNVTNLFQCMP